MRKVMTNLLANINFSYPGYLDIKYIVNITVRSYIALVKSITNTVKRHLILC